MLGHKENITRLSVTLKLHHKKGIIYEHPGGTLQDQDGGTDPVIA